MAKHTITTDARVASTTRRSMLGMIAGVPVAATFAAIPVPALARPDELQHLINRHEAACRETTACPESSGPTYDRLERQMLDAVNALDRYEPRTPHEFVRAFAARYADDDSVPTDEQVMELARIARRLAAH